MTEKVYDMSSSDEYISSKEKFGFTDKEKEHFKDVSAKSRGAFHYDLSTVRRHYVEVPLYIEHIEEGQDRNGNATGFLAVIDCSGAHHKVVVFSVYWQYVSDLIHSGEKYMLMVYKRDEGAQDYLFGVNYYLDNVVRARNMVSKIIGGVKGEKPTTQTDKDIDEKIQDSEAEIDNILASGL